MNANRLDLSRLNKILLSIFLVALLLYLGKPFFIPLAIAVFFAMLLFPAMQKLQKSGLTKPISALLAILLLLAALAALIAVLNYKILELQADLPELETQISEKTKRLQWLVSETTDISRYEQDTILKEKKPDIVKGLYKFIRNLTITGLYLLVQVFIVLSYTFFFLMYDQKIQNFFIKLHIFATKREANVMMTRISRIAHYYLKGTFLVISILGTIYALGFWAIGLEHALLFAIVAALLRIVPYFGSFLGIAFPILFAFLTKESTLYPVLVIVFFMIIQFLEANILTPYITGSRVKLNPLATIMVILLGNLLWGVAGMILFVPLFGIIKVICDQIPALDPYGYILGKEA